MERSNPWGGGCCGIDGCSGDDGWCGDNLPWRARVPVSNSLPVGDSRIPLVWDAGGGQKGDVERMAELQGLSGDGGV